VLNAIWILINLLCIVLTMFHLHKLYRDLATPTISNRENNHAGVVTIFSTLPFDSTQVRGSRCCLRGD
jgi:hypothetical protein